MESDTATEGGRVEHQGVNTLKIGILLDADVENYSKKEIAAF